MTGSAEPKQASPLFFRNSSTNFKMVSIYAIPVLRRCTVPSVDSTEAPSPMMRTYVYAALADDIRMIAYDHECMLIPSAGASF